MSTEPLLALSSGLNDSRLLNEALSLNEFENLIDETIIVNVSNRSYEREKKRKLT